MGEVGGVDDAVAVRIVVRLAACMRLVTQCPVGCGGALGVEGGGLVEDRLGGAGDTDGHQRSTETMMTISRMMRSRPMMPT
jgi:hypothetical protein